MYGRSEIDIKFPTPIPVHITYQTAFVDDAGKLQIRKDIYGRDAVMLGLLKNSRNKDLEVMVSACPAELCAADGRLPAGVRQRQHLLVRPVVLRAPVRRPNAIRRPAPVGRRPNSVSPVTHPRPRISESKSTILVPGESR